MTDTTANLPPVVSRDAWLAARTELLAREKELTRLRDALSADRRRLPMVEVTKDYVFEGPEGKVSLADLFAGRRQLVIGHFMFHPDWDAGCPSCSAGADEMSEGHLKHLAARDTTFVYVSRAPLAKLEAYKAQKGWTFPWYSSHGSDFNYDFDVTLDEDVKPVVYNYRTKAEYEARGEPFQGRARTARWSVRAAAASSRRRHRVPHVLRVRRAGWRPSAGRTTCWTRRCSAGRRTGRSPGGARRPPAARFPISRNEPSPQPERNRRERERTHDADAAGGGGSAAALPVLWRGGGDGAGPVAGREPADRLRQRGVPGASPYGNSAGLLRR